MQSDLNRGEVREEGNLLIEAVSLLVQRQRETESWIAEQIWQAEERSAAAERLHVELETRLAGIEEHLARLVQDVEPLRDDAAVDQRLERLREQVEGLKSSGDARTTLGPAPGAGPSASAASEPRSPVERRAPDSRGLEAFRPSAGSGRAGMRDPGAAASVGQAGSAGRAASVGPAVGAGQAVGFWALLGQAPQDRFGLLLIGAGLVAIVYAVLSQLRF